MVLRNRKVITKFWLQIFFVGLAGLALFLLTPKPAYAGYCGDTSCDGGGGEDCSSCETDCGACPACSPTYCPVGCPTGSCGDRTYNQCSGTCQSTTYHEYANSCGFCAYDTLSTQYDVGCNCPCTEDKCGLQAGCDCYSAYSTCASKLGCSGIEDCGAYSCPPGQSTPDGSPPHNFCSPNCSDPNKTCWASPSCVPPTDCRLPGNECTQTDCPGDSSCIGTPECGSGGNCYTNCSACLTNPTHLECQSASCVSVAGSGIDTCSSNNDCGESYYLTCMGDSCVLISGSGTNSCASDPDCAPPPPPLPTSTPTPTGALPTPTPTPPPGTPTPTPAPGVCPTSWSNVGTFPVGCNTTIASNFSSTMMRMTMASGGGGDNTISFYNNGSTGAHWNASDGSQWSVTNQSGALTVGEVRYTTFFTPRLITSQYFSVGCNDGETMNVAVDRCLPPPNGTITANPNPCQISPIASTCLPGLCCNSAISWSTNNTPSAVVCVDTGSGEILFASNTSGMQNASWIQTGTNYLFRLRTGNTCGSGTLLRSVTVTALPALTCSVTLSPPSLALTQGETGTVVANVLISDGSSPNSSVLRTTFSSDNLLVATLNPVQVTPPGYSTTVTAVGPGSAAISAVVNLLNGNSCSTPTSTAVNVTPPEPWYQTQSGDVHAQGNITSKIPGTILAPNNVFSKDLYSFPGVISFGGASAYFGMGTVSSKGWLANSPFIPTNTSYSYFFSKLGSPTVESFTDGNGRKYCDDVACPGGQSTTQTTIYYAKSRDVNISAGRQWNNIPVGAKIIVLVDGNLNISMNTNGRIIVPVGSFLAFFVKGNIYLEGNMGNKSVSTTPILDGIYMADGIIDTYYPAPSGPGLGSGFRMITGGLFYGGSGVLLNRDIKNDCSLGAICNANTPSEYFGFRPDLVVNTPRELWSGSMSWLEVIP